MKALLIIWIGIGIGLLVWDLKIGLAWCISAFIFDVLSKFSDIKTKEKKNK